MLQAFVSTECCPDSSRKPLRTDASAPDLVQFLKKFHNVPHGAGSKCLRLSLLTEDARDQFFLAASIAHASGSNDLQVHGSDCIRV